MNLFNAITIGAAILALAFMLLFLTTKIIVGLASIHITLGMVASALLTWGSWSSKTKATE